MIKLLILGKTSYVGCSVMQYIGKVHPDAVVDIISSRNDNWEKKSFEEYDAVYNVSGLCHANSKHGTKEEYMEINADLPVKMARKAKLEGVPLFINMSSTIVYGNMSRIGNEKYINKDTMPTPENVYGESKLAAELRLKELEDEKFGVAIIRAPLIYGERAKDNFPRLVRFAKKMPIFPNIKNKQSMIYIDNLCELVYLIVKNHQRGIYMPQDEQYIETSKLVKDISEVCGGHMMLTKIFNPIIYCASRRIYFFNKVFGNIAYTYDSSDYFENRYRVVDYKTAIKRIAEYGERID